MLQTDEGKIIFFKRLAVNVSSRKAHQTPFIYETLVGLENGTKSLQSGGRVHTMQNKHEERKR